ncbi:sigma factor [Streptomyces sp. NPDC101221]|uniref:sigma factor n=1 Tax=Streptomyces sp. NPDC101221 TaxID=3366132 RepID=UPI0038094855
MGDPGHGGVLRQQHQRPVEPQLGAPLGERHARLDEAEDVVQETCPRAWRSCPALEHRSSVRTWLYRIATNACRTACAQKARRPLPTGLPREDVGRFPQRLGGMPEAPRRPGAAG